ncbi:MAG: right-handed parallel beta-helix repeat-containing protein, partial [Bacteroidales bacterium]|nr:right-handed parallel beta-helix repeat-containing protein [Bacteroidales bacterium]
DYSSASVSVTCTDADCDDADGNRILTETAAVTTSTTATCTESGTTTYTATATINGGEVSDEKTVDAPATGHTYAEPGTENADEYISWTWGKSSLGAGVATLTLTCAVCEETWVSDATAGTPTENTDEYTVTVTGPDGKEYSDTYTLTGDEVLTHVHNYVSGDWTWSEDYAECTRTLTCEASDSTTCDEETRTEAAVVAEEKTGATCTEDAYTVYTATFGGETVQTATVTDEGTATGHTAKTYGDGRSYAVYDEGDTGWTAECEVCGEWFAVNGLSGYVLVATDGTSFAAAIGVAKEAGYEATATEITEILIPADTSIELTTYVDIDFNNVAIYGADRETSKIVDTSNEEKKSGTIYESGIQITGSNVTIKNLTIDGSAYNDDGHAKTEYIHTIRINAGDNINIVSCTITGGGHLNNDSSILIQKGTNITIDDCDISGGNKCVYIDSSDSVELTVKGSKLDAEYPFQIEHEAGTISLKVYDSCICGRNSLGAGIETLYFEGCTFGYHLVDYANDSDGDSYVGTYFGVFNAYSDATIVNCYFMAIPVSDGTNTRDPLVNSSRNYAVNARTDNNDDDVTITLIECTFENTNSALTGTKVNVTSDTFMYILGSKSGAKGDAIFVFEDGGDRWKYDTTGKTLVLMEVANEVPVAIIGKKEDFE